MTRTSSAIDKKPIWKWGNDGPSGPCLFSTTEKYGELGRNEIFSLLAATMLLLSGIYKRGL